MASSLSPLAPVFSLFFTATLYLVALVLVLGGLRIAFGAALKGARGERSVRRELDRWFEAAHDLLLPDERQAGGWTQVDHVVRLPDRLVGVETKAMSGFILGTARDARWTQSLGRQRIAFQNPLRQNYKHIRAVTVAGGGAPTEGLVVFTGDAVFPKGLPEGVCFLPELVRRLEGLADWQGDDQTRAAWSRLLAAASHDPADRRRHLRDLRAKHGRDLRRPAGLALAGVGAAVALAAAML